MRRKEEIDVEESPMRKVRSQDRIVDKLRKKIVDGEVPAGSHLSSEAKLAEEYGVSIRLIRESLARLEAEGLLSREQGRGTIVKSLTKAPKQTTQKNIGVFFIGRVRDTSTLEYFEGLQSTFQSFGYGTTIFNTDNQPEKEVAIVRRLVEEGVPGLVLFSAHTSGSFAHLVEAQRAGVQIALIDHHFPEFKCNYVGIDDRDAGCRATTHLLNMGCNKIIYLNSDHDWTAVNNRREGFLQAMRKHADVEKVILNLCPFGDVASEIYEKLPPLARPASGKIGVVAFNDMAAIHAINCLQESGLSVPEEVAVIGFANDLEGSFENVPLTTMHFPRTEIARFAAYLLMHQIQNPDHEPQKIELPANLLIRESCGCYSEVGGDYHSKRRDALR